jgi:hypothetical protein
MPPFRITKAVKLSSPDFERAANRKTRHHLLRIFRSAMRLLALRRIKMENKSAPSLSGK